ncbi:HD domain-containing protein [Defluviimonas sp. WL0024]|uniref:HD domain-containing protein n=1 Tax=Albidovulum salinarum TaxID=2984153 RepID=A0ABT2X0I9_9RHOB|nr:HD domain-containing protein [Defluviimonas sp. WL0024]MCU9847443.1 HD domain-containing protein [Defluviimonas sp. WL0024]
MPDLIARAEAFARQAHAGQTRKGAASEPYVIHLEEVAGFVRRHGGDEIALAAAWLHDTVEDCDGVTARDIARVFGAAVAAVVAELTDDKALAKAERKRLQIVHAASKSPRAALVKLGDKTSNVRSVAASRPVGWSLDRCCAYVDWAEAVVAALPEAPEAAQVEFLAAVAAARRTFGS